MIRVLDGMPEGVLCFEASGKLTANYRQVLAPALAAALAVPGEVRVSAARGFMSADSVAAAVVFLASDDASAIRGSIQLVDQGHLAG